MPDDISLVGFDDREEALLMDPQLSTVRVHKEELGETCMKILLERLHHPLIAFSQRILPTEFVIPGTVCPVRRVAVPPACLVGEISRLWTGRVMWWKRTSWRRSGLAAGGCFHPREHFV